MNRVDSVTGTRSEHVFKAVAILGKVQMTTIALASATFATGYHMF